MEPLCKANYDPPEIPKPMKRLLSNAFRIANNALYFDDSSDYQTALHQVCKALNPNISDDKIGTNYIEER